MATFRPTNPHEWGTGGEAPAEWHGIDTEPFAADPPPREVEEPPEPPPALPGQCIITCITPAWSMRRRGLVTKHGDGWLDTARCPCCGERAAIELTRPVQDCAECGGLGHVAHLDGTVEREPGAFRLALRQAREQLRIRPRERHDQVDKGRSVPGMRPEMAPTQDPEMMA